MFIFEIKVYLKLKKKLFIENFHVAIDNTNATTL